MSAGIPLKTFVEVVPLSVVVSRRGTALKLILVILLRVGWAVVNHMAGPRHPQASARDHGPPLFTSFHMGIDKLYLYRGTPQISVAPVRSIGVTSLIVGAVRQDV